MFVCENNEYGEFTPRDKTMAITDIVDRAAGYGMPGVIVDGMDVVDTIAGAPTGPQDRPNEPVTITGIDITEA